MSRLPISSTVHAIDSCTDQKLVDDALGVLQGMLRSIPTFWGTGELTAVIKLYVEHHSPANAKLAPMASLIKTVAKKVPAKTLAPTLCEIWPSIKASPRHVRSFDGYTFFRLPRLQKPERYNAYFDVLRKSLRAAPRPIVLENIRPLFKVFVEAFDMPAHFSSDASEVKPLSK